VPDVADSGAGPLLLDLAQQAVEQTLVLPTVRDGDP
jgi:hypothetical protein